MDFNYSYRAFLISALLFAVFFILTYSLKLPGPVFTEEPSYNLEYSGITEPEIPETRNADLSKVETNRAYNEAEKLFEEITSSNPRYNEALEKMDAAIERSAEKPSNTSVVDKAVVTVNESMQENDNKNVRRKTTVTYSLKGRTAMELRNPVFTCESSGKVVITIRVNASGRVIKAAYNKVLSTTQNGCLIDSALEYAQRSRFNTLTAMNDQQGLITYNFPGQG